MHNHTLFSLNLRIHQILKKITASTLKISLCVAQLLLQPRSNKRISVNLTVRMIQSHTNLAAVIFKRINLLNAINLANFRGSKRPSFNNRAHAQNRKISWKHVFVGTKANHLTTTSCRSLLPQRIAVNVGCCVWHSCNLSHSWIAVFKNNNVVVFIWNFAILILRFWLSTSEWVDS